MGPARMETKRNEWGRPAGQAGLRVGAIERRRGPGWPGGGGLGGGVSGQHPAGPAPAAPKLLAMMYLHPNLVVTANYCKLQRETENYYGLRFDSK